MTTVGIVGARGYMGGEALRVLLEHPGVEVAWATSRTVGSAALVHPNLDDAEIEFVPLEDAGPCDVAFLALPTAAAIGAARRFLDLGARVIDLGAAFRLGDRELWERVYGQRHEAWDLSEEAVYGVPEIREQELRGARLVANPGCFSSAAILGLAPLVREGWIELDRIVVDGLSGTAGAGAELDRAIHHPEIGGNLIPYNAVGHRHTFEIEQELSSRREELLELYRDFYAGQPFVRVWDLPPEEGAAWQYRPHPWVSAVAGTNHCRMGIEHDPERGRIVVTCVLDSIGKGGAHVGVENMNLMLGLPRTEGLTRRGRHPA
jgi:N-acetyl-gamma-glutamylphosphate reductase